MAKIHGIQSIEIGDVGLDGAPGTVLTPISGLVMDSVTVNIPSIEGDPIYVEEIEGAYDEIDNTDPDPVTVSLATYEASVTTLNTLFGGTLNGGKYTPDRKGVEKTLVINTKERDGKYMSMTFPRIKIRPSIDGTITKGGLTAITINGTALTPFTDAGAALEDFYIEEITPVP